MKKAAVFVILGQSNASGHGKSMIEKDFIKVPLKNVYGLPRTKNQSYSLNKLCWEGYTRFGMNLAEELDNTYSLPNQLAKFWQEMADEDKEIPDLYIVQIAIGAQGVTEKYMWYPKRAEKLVSGKLGEVDISLYPFTSHILSLIDESFKKMNKEYGIIGLHWRGGEEDTTEDTEMLKNELEPIYEKMISEWNRILNNPPIILHRLCCGDRVREFGDKGPKNMQYINSVFEHLETSNENVSVFDARNYPGYDKNIHGNNLFVSDLVHYLPEVNSWAARCIIDEFKKSADISRG